MTKRASFVRPRPNPTQNTNCRIVGLEMKPIEITRGIYDVGVNDWNISDFHGYSTPFGTSYNAYLVLDEKIALIDTVKSEFADELLYNIAKVVDPKKIDLVISNHTEMDHSGSLARIMHRIGEDKPLYCSKMGEKNLQRHFHRNRVQPRHLCRRNYRCQRDSRYGT